MSAGRRISLVVALMTCFALACAVPATHAQGFGSDTPTNSTTLAPPELSLAPSTGFPVVSNLALFLGSPLHVRLSLAAYMWIQPMMDRSSTPEGHMTSPARLRAAPAAWWRR